MRIKALLYVVSFLCFGVSVAQTGIGTTTPHASAKLEVSATNKGFLPPRVTLTSNTDVTTIPSPAEGLLVYNNGNNVGLVAGFYYWNGANWATIATAVAAGYAVASSDLRKIYDGVGNATTINSTGVPFTVTTSGTYLFDFSCSGTNGNGTLKMNFYVREGSTVLKSDMQTSYSNNVHAEYNGKVEVNLVVGKTYNVLVQTSTGYGNIYDNDYCRVYMKQMSGNLPVNQHIADRNIQLNSNYLSNDGDNEGIRIDNSGNVGIGTDTPTSRLNIAGGGVRLATGFSNATNRPSLTSSSIGNYEIRAVGSGGSGSTQNDISDDGFLRLSAGGGSNVNTQSSIDLTGFSTVADMSTNIVMRTEGTERLRITNSGKIGIGTNSPAAALHVASSVPQYVTNYGFLNPSNTGSGYYNTTVSYSIQADQRIRASEFNAISDQRIKTNIFKLNTAKELAELNQLKVVNYSYIDKVVNGDKKKTGFIAQEVEKVNPQLVNQSAEFIPSVFALAKSATIENEILNVTTDQPHGFEKGDLVKLFAEGKKEIIKTIEEVINPKEFLVKGWDAPTENVFVYGKKVSDFRAVDFDQITALSVAAIQELHQQMETLKRENTSLKKTLTNTIQKQQSDIEKRLLQLELKLKKKRK